MRSLRTKILTIVLAFPTLISVAFVIYSLFAAENYKRLRLEGILKTVELETEKVNKTIVEIERGAALFAESAKMHYEAQTQASGVLAAEFLRVFPSAMGGGFWFEPYTYNPDVLRMGIYAFYDGEQDVVRIDNSFNIEEYDYHNSNWYIEITGKLAEPNQVVWTAPYMDDSDSYAMMTTAGAGFFDDNGKLIAVSTVDWEIQEAINELSAINPTANSMVLLSTPEHNYLISNNYQDGAARISPADITGDITADSFDLDGVRYMAFKREMDNGWFLYVNVPADEIFAEMERRNNQFTTIIASSAVLMLWAAFYLISRFINKPLKKLTDEVSELNLGNLDICVSVNTKDELGLLSKTFNKMTADLKASIDNLTAVTAEKERIGAELDVAAKIQASMLPRTFPAFPERAEFDIYAGMQPAKAVGGDFYDFFLIDKDTLAVVIADVSGKGVPAALFMVVAKTLIKNNARYGKSPKEVFETVNHLLREGNEARMFVTAFMGYLDIPSGRFTFVNAGHNPPLLRSASGAPVDNKHYDWLNAKSGFILAGVKNMVYTQHEIILRPGDELFLYTDGVTEAANNEDMLFGDPRLLETMNKTLSLPPKEVIVSVKHEIDKFAEGVEQADDITMLALRYIGGTDK